jgi:hypothetical protein
LRSSGKVEPPWHVRAPVDPDSLDFATTSTATSGSRSLSSTSRTLSRSAECVFPQSSLAAVDSAFHAAKCLQIGISVTTSIEAPV